MMRQWPGPALIKRVSILGFQSGIMIQHYEYSMTFEHLTLVDQRRQGILETPEFHTNDLSQWANVVSFGATANNDADDDGPGIQRAIDFGKPNWTTKAPDRRWWKTTAGWCGFWA